MQISRRALLAPLAGAAILAFARPGPARAATAKEIDGEVDVALNSLLSTNEAAAALHKDAKGILVFPNIVKGGLIIGGAYGEGALRIGGRTEGYYTSVAASFGLQAGAQSFSYALFLMDEAAMQQIERAANMEGGWELGVGPSIVIADKGLAAKLSTTTAREGIYAFIWGQEGLMAGIGIEGSKITRFTPGA